MKYTKLPDNLSMDDIVAAVERDENEGFCLNCGEHSGESVEPDAQNYMCSHCNISGVFGAPEILIMFF